MTRIATWDSISSALSSYVFGLSNHDYRLLRWLNSTIWVEIYCMQFNGRSLSKISRINRRNGTETAVNRYKCRSIVFDNTIDMIHALKPSSIASYTRGRIKYCPGQYFMQPRMHGLPALQYNWLVTRFKNVDGGQSVGRSDGGRSQSSRVSLEGASDERATPDRSLGRATPTSRHTDPSSSTLPDFYKPN